MTLGVAAAAIASGGFLAIPAARADANCTVPGAHLDPHHASGYDATAASLGPTALVRVSPELTSQGNVTGGINGRSIDFMITWYGTEAYVHFTGTVGDDGIAHGTSSETASPVARQAGPWDSITRLSCS